MMTATPTTKTDRTMSSSSGNSGTAGDGEEEQILLDLNTLFPTARFVSLGRVVVSPDHTLLAFTVDRTGAEVYDGYVKDLASGELILHLENVNCIEWGGGSAPYSLLYTCVGA